MRKAMTRLLLIAVGAMACVAAHAQTETGYLQPRPVSDCGTQGSGWTMGVTMVGTWIAPHSETIDVYTRGPNQYGTKWECVNWDQAQGTYLEVPTCPCSITVTTEPTITVGVNPPHSLSSKTFLIVGNCL